MPKERRSKREFAHNNKLSAKQSANKQHVLEAKQPNIECAKLQRDNAKMQSAKRPATKQHVVENEAERENVPNNKLLEDEAEFANVDAGEITFAKPKEPVALNKPAADAPKYEDDVKVAADHARVLLEADNASEAESNTLLTLQNVDTNCAADNELEHKCKDQDLHAVIEVMLAKIVIGFDEYQTVFSLNFEKIHICNFVRVADHGSLVRSVKFKRILRMSRIWKRLLHGEIDQFVLLDGVALSMTLFV